VHSNKDSIASLGPNKIGGKLQKEEMGEVLHEVDFNQLKIENEQYLEKIDEKNQELLRLKLMAGNTLQVLNLYKVDFQFTHYSCFRSGYVSKRINFQILPDIFYSFLFSAIDHLN